MELKFTDEQKEAGKAAYTRYAEYVENKNFLGEQMPTWENLPQKIKDAWCYSPNKKE